MTSKAILVTAMAAAFFAAGTIASVTPAQAEVKCAGANSCKGTSACKTASSTCKGQNSCKGKGWVSTKDEASCKSAGGKIS
jgi:hypothetical protein